MDEKTVKKILGIIIKADEQDWEWERMGKELDAALYSEPQVCPKPEKMMICPSYPEQDKSLCSQCHHFHEHVFEKGNCDRHLTYCKGCIPVPSTPASEVVCQCGHSVIEHFEGGGDVTYCEHKDGFYHCPCPKFVPNELLKAEIAGLQADIDSRKGRR